MCGIVGVSCSTPQAQIEQWTEAMSATLVHRGPDDSGTYLSEDRRHAIGHRRLSIIDLSARGRQPLFNEERTLSVVCNGEIYNHVTLRKELSAKGHHFASSSDSEVILHMYEEYGEDCVQRLDGMFAFILFDHRAGTLFCARDPLGKKPLFYTTDKEHIFIASEIPALLKMSPVDLAYDANAIGLYLLRNLRHVPDPWTLYKGIRSLPPGHKMKVSGGKITTIERYWSPDFTPTTTSPSDILTAFDQAVSKRAVADVEIGALLSGGVDSTAIVDSLKRQGVTHIRTYAFGFDENDEEIARARKAADLYETDHREIYFDAERQHDLFDRTLQQHGQPVMALPLTHAHMLFDAIHQDGLKVVLAGHGADEAFYGYNGAQHLLRLSNLDRNVPRTLSRLLAQGLLPFTSAGPLKDALHVLASAPGKRKETLYHQEAQRTWAGLFKSSPDESAISNWVAPWFSDGAPDAYIDEAAFLGLVQENAHAITLSGDLPAMAHSIEVRCPFMDRSLVEQALKTPYADKIRPSNDYSQGKLILKRALESRLPHDILYAPKRGFGYFVQEEKILRGAWKPHLDNAFQDPCDFDGIFDVDQLRKTKARFDQGDKAIPAILMAKLYALQRFAALGASS